MSRFNETKATVVERSLTENFAGGKAYKESPRLELASLLLTSFLTDKFYESGDEQINRLIPLVKADPEFAAKAAIYARKVHGMRSVSHVVAAEALKATRANPPQWLKYFLYDVVTRPDDMTEILSYFMNKYGKDKHTKKGVRKRSIPHAIKTAFRHALEDKWDAYQIAKYRGEGKEYSLIDLVNLVKPKARKSAEAIALLVKDQLKSVDTWESKLTKAGQEADTEEEKGELKDQAWKSLLSEKKLGIMAGLRNVRNILEQSPDAVGMLCDLLTNADAVKHSKLLPFRFKVAYDQVKQTQFTGTRDALRAITKALDIAVQNVPHMEGKTLIAIDTSGSMTSGYVTDGNRKNKNRTSDSAQRAIDIASLFGAVLYKANNADLMQFHGGASYIHENDQDSVMTIAESILKKAVGGSTNFHSIFQRANKKYDRIIILSDMQGWVGYSTPAIAFAQYKRTTGANPFVYSIDLCGYGTLQIPENKVFALAGWSEKIFDTMAGMEEGADSLIEKIEKIEIRQK